MQHQGHKCQALEVSPWLVAHPFAHMTAELSFPDKPSLSQGPLTSVPQQMFSHFYVTASRGHAALTHHRTKSACWNTLPCSHGNYKDEPHHLWEGSEWRLGRTWWPSINPSCYFFPLSQSNLFLRLDYSKLLEEKPARFNPLINSLPTDQSLQVCEK